MDLAYTRPQSGFARKLRSWTGVVSFACALSAFLPAMARAEDTQEVKQLRARLDAQSKQMDVQAQQIQALQSRLGSLETQKNAAPAATAAAPPAPAAAGAAAPAVAAAGAAGAVAAPSTLASLLPTLPTDGSLTFRGITLYGTVDIGVSYQSHGAALNDYAPVGLDYLVSKNGNRSIASIAPNGMSQSKIGLRGSEEIFDGWSALFRVETGFQPTSGQIADGPKSVSQANGQALASQSTAADSSHAGQAFNRAAYVGVSSPVWGTLTGGRQMTLLADNVATYDPQQSSYAFSVVGYSGLTGGGGSTEDYRLDNSLKYTNKIGPVRVGGLFQFGDENGGSHGNAVQFQLGGDYGDLSLDAVYAHKQDMINLGSLSAAQVKTLGTLGYSLSNSVTATVSDNTSYAAMASYKLGSAKLFAGYEYIEFANPSVPLPAGGATIGGYTLAFVNNAAYNHHRILQVEWTGFRYAVTPELTWSSAYYHYGQNSYSGNGCSNTTAGSCSGDLHAVSTALDYRFSLRFDAYAGAMYSHVNGGLASGYLHTGNISPMAGVRFNF